MASPRLNMTANTVAMAVAENSQSGIGPSIGMGRRGNWIK
jgi:hypothetical protein